ncbi:MAG: glycosyltransferase family 1 protein [Sphingobacteriales bacterium]|nr:MAG: glycosyltransferase family 1 protein [Sphingobacteriales bacterium]
MAFPNAAFTLPPLALRTAGPKRVFYGALNRGAFSAAMARSLGPAIAAHPATSFDVVHDQAFFDALPTDRKNFWPLLDYQDYLDTIKSCDIALLPLAGDDFELFKSDLKYVECASRGAAVIASSAVYAESVNDGRTGLIAHRLEDWAPALCHLLDDEGFRLSLTQNAHAYVRTQRMFTGQIERRLHWYQQLWAQRERLNVELLNRCPALGEP